MKALGKHRILELYDCNNELLNNIEYIEDAVLNATRKSGATVIHYDFHKFSPHGVSGVVTIAESHVSIHTWPEYNYAAVDIFTCGETVKPGIIQDALEQQLEAQRISSRQLQRGLFSDSDQPQKGLPFKPLNTTKN